MNGDGDARVRELRSTLEALISLLRAVGEGHWSSWLEQDRDRVAAGDLSELAHLLAAFGGMGSLTDLQIDPANGHDTAGRDLDEVNAELRALRSTAYTLARELARVSDR